VLTPDQLQALMIEVHREIEGHARLTVNTLMPTGRLGAMDYPPNGGLTDEERTALSGLASDPAIVSGLRKVIAASTGSFVFRLLNLVDGTADPLNFSGDWGCVELVEGEGDQMLHEHFFETYWDWRVVRPDPGWRLDLLPMDPHESGEHDP
jgi:hypothetical protein